MVETVFLGLLFADRIIVEEGTNKKSLVGTFSFFYADQVPAVFAPWFIYAAATNLVPDEPHTFSVNIAHDDSQTVVFSAGGEFGVGERNATAELVLPVVRAPFPKFGDYPVQFNVDGREIATRNLRVVERSQAGGQE